MTTLDDDIARHHAAAFGWALACCRWDRSAAEDVLQTAYLKIMDGSAEFSGRSAFRTFLFGVIRRTAITERRRRAVRAVLPMTVFGKNGARPPAVTPVVLSEIVREESAARLIAALEQLSARQREVLHLVFYEDLTIAEASGVIGVPVGTARKYYERGKAQLRRRLGDTWP